MKTPFLIECGVVSSFNGRCMACGSEADMWNVLGSFCSSHKDNFVREYRTVEDLNSLNIIQDPIHREHCKKYMKEVWKL